MERKISIKNLYLVGVISLGLIGLGVGSTFAMFTANAEINDSISMTSGLGYTDDIIDLVDMTVSSNKVETATLNITNNTTKTLNYTSWYKTNNDNLQIGTVVSNNHSVTGTIEPGESMQIIVSIRNRGTGVAKVVVGISASEDDIVVSDGITTLPSDPLPPYLSDYITNLYTGATKSTVTNNSIDYNYATSVNLMNDRLGGTTESLDGGNIRYYGSTPNNYIDIGDRTSNNEVILWRIIGVFDGKIRVVRNESIGNYSWDTSPTNVNDGYGINEWSQADLMKLLNPGYENNQDFNNANTQITVNNSLWWLGNSGICYNQKYNGIDNCDFSNIELSDNVKNNIQSQTIYIGGLAEHEIYADQAYIGERGNDVVIVGTDCNNSPCNDTVIRTTQWNGKVSLMYSSDYGYSEDFSKCNKTLYYYKDEICAQNNWVFDSTIHQWLITPTDNRSNRTWSISDQGAAYAFNPTYTALGVRPVLLLNSKVVLESGTGTDTDPYVVD